MSQMETKPNLNLATLSEGISILRDVLRRYVTEHFQADFDQLLKVLESSGGLQQDNTFQDEVDKRKRGEGDVEDLIDVSSVGRFRHHFVKQCFSFEFQVHFQEIKLSTQKITKYRNKVCHPPLRDISDGELRTALNKIHNLLSFIGANQQELLTVDLLRKTPFVQTHCQEARENRDLRYEIGQLKSELKGRVKMIAIRNESIKDLKDQLERSRNRASKKRQ